MNLRNSLSLFLLIFVTYLCLFATEISSKQSSRRKLPHQHFRRTFSRRSGESYSGNQISNNMSSTVESKLNNEGSMTNTMDDDYEPYPPPSSSTTTVKTTSTSSTSKISANLPNFTSTNLLESKTPLVDPTKLHKEREFKTVKIKSGKIRGKIVEVEPGKRISTYLGIQYAQSPTGDRRFKPPTKVKHWNKTRDALEYGNSCVQWRDLSFEHFIKGFRGTAMWNTNTKVSEDCLYLNIWTPKTSKHMSANLAVMVWIYGGGFYSGTSSLDVYDGKWLAAYEEVVVVSMNYRVGALGFLALDDDQITGNAGLFDQQMALQWVQDNIHRFGGDPKNVTLFGESAGAVSIALHMLSDGSKGLFKNVILQSASALSPWSILDKKEAKRRAEELADSLHCSNMTGKNYTFPDAMSEEERIKSARISCLHSIDPQKLVNKEMEVGYGIARFPNAAVVDGKFLKLSPHEAPIEGLWHKDVNVLAGFNANEGNYFIVYSSVLNYNLSTNNTIGNSGFSEGIAEALRSMIDFESSSQVTKNVLTKSSHFIYTGGYRPLPVDSFVPGGEKFLLHNDKRMLIDENVRARTFYRDRLDDMVGDINFVCPTIAFLDKILDRQISINEAQTKTFLYKFVHRSSRNPWPGWMGVMHGYEIEFVFGIPLNESSGYSDVEREISRSVMKMWGNFAKHGNPNYKVNATFWPPYNHTGKNIFIIGEQGEKINTRSSLYSSNYSNQLTHCAYWREHFPNVQHQMAGLSDETCHCPNLSEQVGKGGVATLRISSSFLSILLLFVVFKNIG